MNKERRDEREAKRIVEEVAGVKLKHADHEGGVDYRSIDGRHAVEVTRITDGRKRAGRDALGESRKTGTPDGELQTCWVVFAPDTQQRLKTFLQRVHPAFVHLELAGELRFERQVGAVHLMEHGPMSLVYRTLLEAGVERAFAVQDHAQTRHVHRIVATLGSGGSVSGANEALNLLTEELSKRKDNPTKLRDSGAKERHLFVWLDGDTRFDIERPLSREAPPWASEGFGAPSVPPAIDPVITHLWVVHEGSRLGWLWDGETWRELRDL